MFPSQSRGNSHGHVMGRGTGSFSLDPGAHAFHHHHHLLFLFLIDKMDLLKKKKGCFFLDDGLFYQPDPLTRNVRELSYGICCNSASSPGKQRDKKAGFLWYHPYLGSCTVAPLASLMASFLVHGIPTFGAARITDGWPSVHT